MFNELVYKDEFINYNFLNNYTNVINENIKQLNTCNNVEENYENCNLFEVYEIRNVSSHVLNEFDYYIDNYHITDENIELYDDDDF